MIGAIIGDIIGSRFERQEVPPSPGFDLFTSDCHFTDDTVLTVAIASSILNKKGYAESVKSFGRNFPNRGYGASFRKWLASDSYEPYNSWGNGSAMRVSPIAYAFDTEERVLAEAEKSAAITHNHPEGIKGGQAIALAVFLAKNGKSKAEIKKAIEEKFDYDLNRTLDGIRPTYKFDVSCQGSVPEAIIAFLESDDFESAIRLGISIGGDTDTIACMAGSIAEAFYGEIPAAIINEAMNFLDEELRLIVDEFKKYKFSNDEV